MLLILSLALFTDCAPSSIAADTVGHTIFGILLFKQNLEVGLPSHSRDFMLRFEIN